MSGSKCESAGRRVSRGRPATERGAYNPHPARQLGRVAEQDWCEIKAACEAAGQSMVEWALPTLLQKARRESKRRAEGR